MRILLIGADGFLGRHVTDRLLADPEVSLTVLGRREGADIRFDLAEGQPGVLARFIDAVAPRAVINCAGATRGGARDLTLGNTVAVATLCEAMRRSRHRARLVHLGSAAEYGAVPPGVVIDEATPPQPVGGYGFSKLAGTELVTSSGLDAVVLRVFNPIGPGTPGGTVMGRLATALREAMENGTNVARVGDLSAFRDFVDVRDVARAVHAATVSGAQGVINIGSGVPTRVREAARMLVRAAGFVGRVEEEGVGSERSADVLWQQADVRAAKERLGWRYRIPLDESLADVWMEAACKV
ncbi:NAD-dependent epimerase/dehydratase family protein [Allostreptomyces psammosilenae]|uniref:Nucleoside-diphosphate-sugar epimerase n=1 Tax=Allostreptomyces psammosilenae TaxID=1892865 RepID=A0A853A180_9ACTN|nr:NAD(P)-dependent oxidoreductase [Allostreptomyces psammosilenae]NYI08129.1 nucleoside-diphosphate-sugar epimerase [Allostreptomyces psammosilenae]